MRYVILHYHIMKNAGSTVEEILGQSFWENFCRFDSSDRDASIPNTELMSFVGSHPAVQAVSSYQVRYPLPAVLGYIFADWCVLRDPIDRYRSMYYYLREQPDPGDPLSDYANGLALGGFIKALVDEIAWYANDVQVNLLANGIVNDPPNRKDLERAAERMLGASFLGVVDCFAKSLAAGQYFLSPMFPSLNCAHLPVNVAPLGRRLDAREELRQACNEQVYSKLLELNALDCELVERARTEVQRRFEMIPNREAWLRKVTPEAGQKPQSETAQPPAVSEPASKESRGLTRKLRRNGLAIDLQPDDQHAQDLLTQGGENHPLFDAAYYLKCNPDVRKARMNPLVHYVLHGARENRQPHPLFLPDYYLTRYPEARGECGGNPLVHFLESDPKNCGSPHPLFDCEYYLHANPEVAAEGINPLVHYVLSGNGEDGADINLDGFQTLRLDVHGVTVVIAFVDAPNEKLLKDERLAKRIVQIWKDTAGRTRFIAPPQQHPFFQGVSYDQLYAQIAGAPVSSAKAESVQPGLGAVRSA